jgi:hypothetical protein
VATFACNNSPTLSVFAWASRGSFSSAASLL